MAAPVELTDTSLLPDGIVNGEALIPPSSQPKAISAGKTQLLRFSVARLTQFNRRDSII